MFLQAFADGDLALVDLVIEDVTRVMELVDTYRDFPLGTTDASAIAIAERLNITDVATLDHRHLRTFDPGTRSTSPSCRRGDSMIRPRDEYGPETLAQRRAMSG